MKILISVSQFRGSNNNDETKTKNPAGQHDASGAPAVSRAGYLVLYHIRAEMVTAICRDSNTDQLNYRTDYLENMHHFSM
mgnify:CR=1 FL=1